MKFYIHLYSGTYVFYRALMLHIFNALDMTAHEYAHNCHDGETREYPWQLSKYHIKTCGKKRENVMGSDIGYKWLFQGFTAPEMQRTFRLAEAEGSSQGVRHSAQVFDIFSSAHSHQLGFQVF